MTIIADSGALFAAYNSTDDHHGIVRDFLGTLDEQLVVPPLILAELDYMAGARLGEPLRATIMGNLVETAEVAEFTQDMFKTAAEIAAGYADLQLGLTDASVMVTAFEYRTRDILTVDQRHFRAVRPAHGRPGKAFRLLPFDAQA